MKNLFVLLFLVAGFAVGQVVSLPLAAGARITLLDVAVVTVLIVAAVRSTKKRIIPSLWAPVMAFFGVTLLSLAGTYTDVPLYVTGGGLLYVLRWITYAALYWVAVGKFATARNWNITLILAGVIMAIGGLIQYAWYPDLRNLYYLGWDPHYQRLFGTLFDPNFMGILLTLSLVTMLGWEEKSIKLRLFKAAGITVVLSALLLTYSRSSFIAFLTGIILWGILMHKKMLTGIIIFIMAVSVVALPSTGEGRNLMRTVSTFARIGSAERALTLIREKPLLGHGFNLLRYVAAERSWIDEGSVPSRAGAGLDTSLLFVGATTGVVGMLVYGWLLVSLVLLGIRAYAHKPLRAQGAVFISLIAAIVVHSLFINSLFYPWVMAWMWLAAGALEQEITVYT
ncbi:O-antigen ligase family protein [Candidatus Gottesmanbacteria bacterium]|nr:O-antigen ligase family protein [Candidatus Gottesmanbacteria bacterium]